MAFFKFRKGGDESPATPSQPESVEALRRRARHRLIGATVLVLLGVLGFPLLFDTQPRPIAVDIPIEIPDRNKAKPLAVPAPAAATNKGASKPADKPAGAAAAPAAPAINTAGATSASKAEPPAPPPAVRPEPPRQEARAEPKPEPKPEPKVEPKAVTIANDGAKARALLEGTPVESVVAAASETRFIVQVGAYADVAKAREARQKLEKAGLKTYTQVAETKDGKRIRVRVGPFGNRTEADKAAQKIKGLDLSASVLTL